MIGFLFLIILVAVFLIKFLLNYFKPGSASPFSLKSVVKERPPVELDQKKRDAVIKQSFSPEKVPQNLDAIVIGSGAGGLTTAVLLAKAGRKVLVLEQHDQAGGCCHTYEEKGFEFDVGIHYVGNLHDGQQFRMLIDQLTDGKLHWVPIDKEFDTVVLGEPSKGTLRKYPLVAGRQEYWDNLKRLFPNDQDKVDELHRKIKKHLRGGNWLGLAKILPLPIVKLLHKYGILDFITDYFKLQKVTLEQVMNEIGRENQDLRAVIGYCFGDFGGRPDDTPFTMQALLLKHFERGAFYPKGGASEIAFHMIPIIERAGGGCLVRASVTEILFNKHGKASGVRVAKGTQTHDIMAPCIVSDAGVLNTFGKLVPKQYSEGSRYHQYLTTVGPGVGVVSLFVGLEGTKEELNLPAANFWCFPDADYVNAYKKFLSLSYEEAIEGPMPLMFVSFPSAKDPEWEKRYPGKSTCAIITMANYKWFEPYEKVGNVKHRGDEYEALKNDLGRTLWQQCIELFPQLDGKDVYFEVGTPLTNNHYINSQRGEIYGLDHSVKRFSAEATMDLRPDTDIPGLYLTGQDVAGCGYSGATYGGLFCASKLLNRQLMFDLVKLYKERNKQKTT